MRWGAYVVGAALVFAAGAALAAEPLGGAYPAAPAPDPARRGSAGIVVHGTDRFVGGETPVRAPLPGGMVTLNLVEAPLPVAAKAVLADTLGWGYTLDERASGTLTLQTGGPVTRDALLAMFETALGSRGLVLRRRGRTALIAPAGGTGVQPVQGPGAEAGAVVVPLRWIAAAEMQAILASVAPREVLLRADRTRNVLILSGDAGQIRALRQTIEVFDVDWMRGMSTAMLPVRSANPRTIARDLSQIFNAEAAGTGDMIRFVPNEALSAILVVSSRAVYLDRARAWLEQLESLAAERERQIELLVVLAIIGMIATMVTPQVIGYLGRAKGETARIQVKNIAQAVELYYLDNGAYPTAQQGLQGLVQPTGPGWRGPYIRDGRGLTDPWGQPYLYRSPGADGKPYQVYSLGSDRQAGGSDDAADVASD
ncbi:hypothetical protein CLBKND_01105 [Methylorubrum aminovorans]